MKAPDCPARDLPSSSLHVLCVVPRGLEGKGGIDRLFRYLAANRSYTDTDDIEVTFFTSRGDTAGPGWISLFPFRVLQYIGYLIFRRIDIVHLNLSINASAYRKYILLAIARFMRKKVIVHFHGGGFEHMLRGQTPSVKLILEILRKADHTIVLGEFWSRLLKEAAGLAHQTVHVIYNAVPDIGGTVVSLHRPQQNLRLVFAGELHFRKGLDVLLEALAILNDKYRAWTCIIAGNGPIEAYRETSEKLGISRQASFVGWLRVEPLHRIMLESDVVVLPSRGEGLPLCLVEAAAAGAAMVATDEGATREVLHDGINGIIVPLDPAAIADTLYHLAHNRDLLASMQAASRALYLQRFGLDCMVRDLHAVYRIAANRTVNQS